MNDRIGKRGRSDKARLSAVEQKLCELLSLHQRALDLSTPKDGHCLFHALVSGGLLDNMGEEGV